MTGKADTIVEDVPVNEAARLAAVRRYDILDTPPDGAFDRITAMAARLFKAPIAIVSIVDHDRIWFKSHHGLDVTQIGRDPGLCASAIMQAEPYVLSDAKLDPRSLANPLVAGDFGLRFYAAAPLRTADGFNLGTLCVIDKEPRPVNAEDIAQLQDLAAVVIDQMELRRSVIAALAGKDAVVDKLADSERSFRTLADAMPQLVWTAHPDGFIHWYNQGWYRYTGTTPEAMEGWGWQSVHDPKTLPSVMARWQASIATGDPFEMTFPLRGADGIFRHFLTRVMPQKDDQGRVLQWYGTNTDVEELRHAEERQDLLLKEMDHRIKNLFAIVGGIVALSARTATTPRELAEAIQGRMGALASAHQLVRVGHVGSAPDQRETNLDDLIQTILAPYVSSAHTGGAARVVIEGPQVAIAGDAITSFALVFHELATNAAKYGALSVADGQVAVTWSMSEGDLQITWRERGGPAVKTALGREGFGSLLARRSVIGQLCGQLTYDWDPDGLTVRLSAAPERLGA